MLSFLRCGGTEMFTNTFFIIVMAGVIAFKPRYWSQIHYRFACFPRCSGLSSTP